MGGGVEVEKWGGVPGIEIPGLWLVGVRCVVVTSPPPLRGGFVLLCLFHGLRDAFGIASPVATFLRPFGAKRPVTTGLRPFGGRGGSWDGEGGGRGGLACELHGFE